MIIPLWLFINPIKQVVERVCRYTTRERAGTAAAYNLCRDIYREDIRGLFLWLRIERRMKRPSLMLRGKFQLSEAKPNPRNNLSPGSYLFGRKWY